MLLEKCKYVVKEKKLPKYIIVYYYICKCYQRKKEKLSKEPCERYQNLSEKEKEKKGPRQI